ncbi:MAG: response regulator [Proteobacteria bacterium]|nr:response regulator [Pseudomonadota bacterium]
MQNKDKKQNPIFRPLITTAVSLFITEILIMLFLLAYLPTLPIYVLALIDAFLLTALVVPLLYTSFVVPMQHHVKEGPNTSVRFVITIIVAISIVFTESLIMLYLFSYLPTLPNYQVALIDALLLTVLIVPFLYFLLIKPVSHHFKEASYTPLRFFLLVAVSIFFVESYVMFILPYLPTLPIYLVALIDAFLLTVLISPLLYFILVKPLIVQIRERRLAEERLRQHKDHLEDVVEERTIKLRKAIEDLSKENAERKSLEAEVLKTQKLESLGVLAGGIAHDFNNLLTGIIGNLSLMEQAVDKDGDFHERLTATEKAAMQASELTKQLLTFSKGGEPIKETIPIGVLIQESTCFALRGSNVNPKFTIPDDLWLVDADKGQVPQVINNLAINADQAMPDGGTLMVSAENHNVTKENRLSLKNGRYVKISVKDQGVGIPRKLLNKIFDPYFTTKQKGSGLGLASAYSVVKKHGGCIDVNSELGVGTTFRIYLPASERRTVERKTAEKEVAASDGGRILVMDDEEIVRDVAGAMLSNLGYEVVTAKDGSEAINLYKESSEAGKPFKLVIMDLTIPGGMGGTEAVTGVLEFDPSAKVIVSSGYSNDPVMADFKKYGFCGVILKPYNANALGVTVHKVLVAKEE